MAKESHLHSDMAHARQSDGINVIFDQKSPPSSSSHCRSRSRSSSSSNSSGSGVYRGRGRRRGYYRSSSSSSSSSGSSSSPRPRSRSHPRCYRRSSRCRCANHYRYSHGRRHHSPPRRYRAHSRSYSRSPSHDRYSHRRRYRSPSRSRSRSSSRWSRYRRSTNQHRFRVSSARTDKSHSRSRSSGRSISLSVHDKKELLKAAEENAKKILGVENLELPESVKPILPEQSTQSKQWSPEPETRVRQSPGKIESQSDEEPDISGRSTCPKRKIIAFSINNSVAKPTVAAPPCAKVTPRVDSYESRKPYGHWVPVKSGQTSKARKHAVIKSH